MAHHRSAASLPRFSEFTKSKFTLAARISSAQADDSPERKEHLSNMSSTFAVTQLATCVSPIHDRCYALSIQLRVFHLRRHCCVSSLQVSLNDDVISFGLYLQAKLREMARECVFIFTLRSIYLCRAIKMRYGPEYLSEAFWLAGMLIANLRTG
jgi:hypothetical protein